MYFFGADSILTDVFEAFIDFTRETSENKHLTYELRDQRNSLLDDLKYLVTWVIGMIAVLVINELLKKSLIQRSFSIFIETLAQNVAFLFVLCPLPIKIAVVFLAIMIYREPIEIIFYLIVARFKSYFNETQQDPVRVDSPTPVPSDHLIKVQKYKKMIESELRKTISKIAKMVIPKLQREPEQSHNETQAHPNKRTADALLAEQDLDTQKLKIEGGEIEKRPRHEELNPEDHIPRDKLNDLIIATMLELYASKVQNKTPDVIITATQAALRNMNNAQGTAESTYLASSNHSTPPHL